MTPPASDDELRRLVEEAARAAKAAQDAAERVAREQPPWWSEALKTIATLLTTLLEGVVGRLRAEIEGLKRSGEDFAARLLLALSRSAQHLARALALMLVAGVLLTTAVIVLAIGFVELLNATLGAPWGTLAAGGLFLVLAVVVYAFARLRLARIREEAAMVAPRMR